MKPKTIKPQQKVIPKQQIKTTPAPQGKKSKARAGETWSINDAATRGHKSTITKVKNAEIRHIPRTHKPITRNIKNIELKENPQKSDERKTYILPKVQRTNIKYVGKKRNNEDIKNPIDKSIIRHLKKNDKKNK